MTPGTLGLGLREGLRSLTMYAARCPRRELSRRLQLIKTRKVADHLLTHAQLHYLFGQHEPRQQEEPPPHWDYEKLLQRLTKGSFRAEFMERLEFAMGSFRESDDYKNALQQPTPDLFFELMDDIAIKKDRNSSPRTLWTQATREWWRSGFEFFVKGEISKKPLVGVLMRSYLHARKT